MLITGTVTDKGLKDAVETFLEENPELLDYWRKSVPRNAAAKAHINKLIKFGEAYMAKKNKK